MNATPEKLQYLATKSVCLELVYEWADNDTIPVVNMWRYKTKDIACPDHDWFLWQMCEMPISHDIAIPTPIRNQIEDTISSILDPIGKWIKYHHAMECFHEEAVNSLKPYIKSLVWTKDFEIDLIATAKKISSNTNLSQMERFRFACKYCLIEDLENFKDLANTVKELNFQDLQFMVYWSKYLANELDTLSGLDITLRLHSGLVNKTLGISMEDIDPKLQAEIMPVMKDSIEGFLFEMALMSYTLWPPVAYFFTKLRPAHRIRRFSTIVELCGKTYRKELLAKLTDELWIAAGKHSIRNLIVLNRDYFEDVRYIWSQFKDEMNSKNFCDMIEELVPLSWKNPTNFNIWTPFLIKIWSSVSDEFKRAATNVELWLEIGKKIRLMYIPLEDKSEFYSSRRIPDGMKFIRLVVSYMDVKNREIFLRENFFWLIIWQPFEKVKKLLKEFLIPRNLVKFKNEVKESVEVEKSLTALLAFAEFEEFDTIASFCFSGKNDTISVSHQYLLCYKWTIMVPPSGMDLMSMCLFFVDWKNLFEYMKNTFQGIAIPPDSYMITLLELGCIRHYASEKIRRGGMRDIMECISHILSSTDPRLPDLKSRFKTVLHKCLFDVKSNESMIFKCVDVQDFLLWIYNGDQALIEKNFRKRKLLRKGFLMQIITCTINQSVFEASDSMEEFLKWCFPSEEERRRFKWNMIRQYRKYDTIKNLLWLREFRRTMLSWFCDNDTKLINEFLTEHVGADYSEPEKVAGENEAEKKLTLVKLNSHRNF